MARKPKETTRLMQLGLFQWDFFVLTPSDQAIDVKTSIFLSVVKGKVIAIKRTLDFPTETSGTSTFLLLRLPCTKICQKS